MTQRDLVVGLELNARNFNRGADSASGRLSRFGNEAREFGRSSSASFGKANRGQAEVVIESFGGVA
jgi:hypothetical protein